MWINKGSHKSSQRIKTQIIDNCAEIHIKTKQKSSWKIGKLIKTKQPTVVVNLFLLQIT